MNARNGRKLTKCDFCAHHTRSGCTAAPNAYNCRQANNEFYAYLANQKKGNNRYGNN